MNRLCIVAMVVAGLVSPAFAGPSLICMGNDIGGAASLPWGGRDWKAVDEQYPHDRLVKDTLAFLTPKAPVIARMETLRRATIYARKFEERGHRGLVDELLSRLTSRALDAEARGAPDALAWFDAGYFAASVDQWFPRRAGLNDGYAWVTKALALRPNDAEMEFAAVLMRHESPQRPGRHWARAAAGSKSNALLAKNMTARWQSW